MKRIAIIGTGIAGLGCAYFLKDRAEITLFEKNDYVGGHTNTVEVTEGSRQLPVDTGFMVFNQRTYPNLCRLFEELDVAVKPTDMSFSVRHEHDDIEWNGAGFTKLFAQRRNIFRPRYLRMLGQMNRFNQTAMQLAQTGWLNDPPVSEQTIGQFAAAGKYGEDFLNLFLLP
ncbi:MAG: FAD-dependent oxidoreductase, partial [Vampirovibrio sp.]|nr:FAD-dependent oxidoreductase [Vampirovibrio sp.]